MLKINRKLSKEGFSLIELMVAAAILSLAIFGIFQAYSTGFLGMFDARDRTVATNYVQEKMEELKNADFDTVVDEASSQIVGDIKFSRNVNVEYIDGSTNLIVSGPTNLKRVTTKVNWNDRNGIIKKVESSVLLQDTQFTPGDAARISLYADPYNVVLPITDTTTIIAVIKDSKGNNIFDWDGSDVTFTIDSGEEFGTLSDYAVPPVQGRASVILTSSGTDPETAPVGTMIIKASVTTADGENTFTDTIAIDVTWGAVKIELIPNPSSILANSTSTSTITATIQNAAGETVEEGHYDITFTVDGEGTLIGSNPVTSDSGQATITLQSTTTAGIATVTATSPQLFSDSCDVRTSGLPAGITLSASPNPMYSDDISEVTVTIVDENGVPVIPSTTMTVGLTLSGSGFLSVYSLEFNNVSVRTMNYTHPLNTEEIVKITATDGSFTEDINISVELKLDADHIELNADPSSIPADGGNSSSTITATIKDSGETTVRNFNGTINFLMLNGLDQNGNALVSGTLSETEVTYTYENNGVATIELESGSIPGTCRIQADGTLPSPSATIDVGFYSDAVSVLLTATREHIPVGGGNEGTSILTASIKDAEGTTVYNYKGNVNFTFLSGYNSNNLLGNAKFKFVNNQSYSVPVFHGIASVYLLSLNNSGVALLRAVDDPSGFLTTDELTIYIDKTLKLAVVPNIIYSQGGKNVSFDIEVKGGNITIDRMKVTWSPDNLEELTNVTIDVDGNISNNSGEMLNGSDFDIVPINLLEGTISPINKVTLTFDLSIEGKDISIIFYPAASESYCEDSYEINL